MLISIALSPTQANTIARLHKMSKREESPNDLIALVLMEVLDDLALPEDVPATKIATKRKRTKKKR